MTYLYIYIIDWSRFLRLFQVSLLRVDTIVLLLAFSLWTVICEKSINITYLLYISNKWTIFTVKSQPFLKIIQPNNSTSTFDQNMIATFHLCKRLDNASIIKINALRRQLRLTIYDNASIIKRVQWEDNSD